MRKSKFTEEQIIAIVTEQERGMATGKVCRMHGHRAARPTPIKNRPQILRSTCCSS